MQALSDLADQMRMLPAAILVACGFALAGWLRGAVVWLLGVGATFAVVAALKLLLLECGRVWTGGALVTPSGHTAAAAVVYGTFVVLAVRSSTAHWRPALVAPIAAAILIGMTRLALGVHTLLEAVVGGAVGLAGAYGIVAAAGPPPRRLLFLASPALLLAILLFPGRLQAEAQLYRLAGWLGSAGLCRTDSAALPPKPPT